jgi:hypothetical protein
MFIAGKDGNLELLTQGPALKHHALVYGQAPYLPTDPSISGGVCSGLNPYTWLYYCSVTTSRGLLIWKTILQSSAGVSSSSSS